LDEWNEKLDKARGEVAELNIRFADWYYVVSEEQFQKVQLDRDDLIKQKEKEEGADTASTSDAEPAVEESVEEMDEVETFQDLQQEGLEADDE
jgi:hypothetical protein